MSRITKSDIEHLSWIWQRLVNHHGENQNMDYMHKLNGIIISLKLDYAYDEMEEEPDKEIAAMEKQYKYENANYAEAWIAIKEFEEGAKFYRELDGKYYEASNVQEVLSLHINNALLVKVEVTQEELHEQKVEKLADHLHDKLSFLYSLDAPFRELEMEAARLALEWMKQNGE